MAPKKYSDYVSFQPFTTPKVVRSQTETPDVTYQQFRTPKVARSLADTAYVSCPPYIYRMPKVVRSLSVTMHKVVRSPPDTATVAATVTFYKEGEAACETIIHVKSNEEGERIMERTRLGLYYCEVGCRNCATKADPYICFLMNVLNESGQETWLEAVNWQKE